MKPTTERRKRVGYTNGFAKYRFAYGKGKCGYCGNNLPKRRKYWCSNECVQAIYEESSWVALRWKIIKEQKTCRMCGAESSGHERWVVDHIVPIALGGGEFDKTNLQLLCPECNKAKTAIDLSKILSKGFPKSYLNPNQTKLLQFGMEGA